MTSKRTLPKGFEDLAGFVPEWTYASEGERNAFRVARSLADLQSFYDATMPRLEEISSYLNNYPLTAMPRDCANLLELALMTMEVAPAVEYYHNPDVPNAVAYEKYRIYPLASKYTVDIAPGDHNDDI